ncbi:DUF4190 domain-containing protein [Streptomyces sp. NPDC058655]|uniref:DUF4190 domain-containing protein n=1 Tax=Streptomyces sp. NPDC058655 TaxID=3346577 RepID=UPI0036583F14
MTENSPEPRDPWAPPERPAVELGKTQGTPQGPSGPAGASGAAGAPGPPSVHDQPTLAGMPGESLPPSADTATSGQAAYGYPAPPDAGGYGYPAARPAVQGYGYPGDAGYAGHPGYPGHPGGGPTGYPPYGQRMSNGFGITALVLGILAVVLGLFGCFVAFLGIPLGIGAVIFGALGRGKAARGEADNAGLALAGIITGAVGIVAGILVTVMFFGVLAGLPGGDSDYRNPYTDSSEIREKV